MSSERIDRLEERLAWLQRHVVEQDKAMLEMAGQLDRLKAELTRLKQRAETAPSGPDPTMTDERPPHY
ncbi:MAG TPA: SlyX family protein [Rariglobus sp.]